MLYDFLDENRVELIDRCRVKVAERSTGHAATAHAEHGVPLFLGQLIDMLRMEDSTPASGTAQRDATMKSGATLHGNELLRDGYTVEQVVRDYGDLCQAVTELAIEKRSAPSPTEFRTLNRCLDNAIANAVTEFARKRDEGIAANTARDMSERLGSLAHELRNFLNTAILSFAAIKSGAVAANGATSAVLDRSLLGVRDLIDRALADVRLTSGMPPALEEVDVAHFIAEVQVAGCLEAKAKGCELIVAPVAPGLVVCADRQLLYSAVANLLQNAFKFTHTHGQVRLSAVAKQDRVRIEVEDRCGGLPVPNAEDLFHRFTQFDQNRTGLGLGLSIARRAVEANGGTLMARDMPRVGCVFTVDLPIAEASC
ncbi:MAG: HAMP domain-containing sensor histidine kinase [Usitatibacter sp.]